MARAWNTPNSLDEIAKPNIIMNIAEDDPRRLVAGVLFVHRFGNQQSGRVDFRVALCVAGVAFRPSGPHPTSNDANINMAVAHFMMH